MTEHAGDALRNARLAGERTGELAHGGDLRGGGRGLREPLAEDRGEHRIGVRCLNQRKVSVLGERGVGGIRLAERELEDVAVVGLLGAGLRDDAQETGLSDRALGRGKVSGGEPSEADAGGEDRVFEDEVSLT